MKLASLREGRDGRLVVVSRDLGQAVAVPEVAATLQQALDNWSSAGPALQHAYEKLNAGELSGMPFDEGAVAAPLPRAYQWADGSAYVNHVELVRKARGAEMPESFWSDPLMYQGGSDILLGARDPIVVGDLAWGVDCEAEVAVITDDVPMGMSAADVSLRNLIPGELAKGFGFFHGKPPTAFSPVAVTADELGDALHDYTVGLPMRVRINGEPFGQALPDVDQTFTFPQLIAHAAKTRPLGAGTIIGSGTISNKLDGGPGKPIAAGGVGYSCIAEIRCVETIEHGEPKTAFLKAGDRVEVEMLDPNGNSIFGRIDQTVQLA